MKRSLLLAIFAIAPLLLQGEAGARSDLVAAVRSELAFDAMDASLAAQEGEKLGALIDRARRLCPLSLVTITAYAGSDEGNDELTRKLSRKRAAHVALILQKHGVKSELIRTEAKGNSKPLMGSVAVLEFYGGMPDRWCMFPEDSAGFRYK